MITPTPRKTTMKPTVLSLIVLCTVFLMAWPVSAIKFYQDINMQDDNMINAGGNQITNVAPGIDGMDAVNVSQLTNAAGDVYNALNSLSNFIGDVMITNVANYDYLTNQVDDTYVNITGDTMTGPLTINNNLIVNGSIYAETSTFINIVVSNTALITTNLTLQGVLDMSGNQITNMAPGTAGMDAVNYNQLTGAVSIIGGNLTAATNQTLLDAKYYTQNYTDAATNAVGETWDERWVNEDGDDMTGILGMGGNRITNLAPGVAGMDAVNVNQLTNAAGNVYGVINNLSNYIGNVMITNVADYSYLTGQVDDTYVNITGDTMTGPLVIQSDLTVDGTIRAGAIYAETSTFVNIVVSNAALITTNLTLQGVLDMSGNQITNLAPGTAGMDAVNYDQLTTAVVNVGGNLVAATNQVTINLNNYIAGATNAIGEVWDERWVNEDGDDMTGILGMGGNRITNLAPGTVGTDAVNLNQLTNAAGNAVANINALSNYIANGMITNVANYNFITGQVDATYVNITGDDMTGILGMGGNVITNLGPATRGDMAVNYDQLTNAVQQAQDSVDLQKAYDNGNSIATTAGKGNVNISGSQALNVTADGGVNVNGGSVNVSGSTSQGVNLDGTTGNEGIRLNSDGKLVIYSGGSIAMEFE